MVERTTSFGRALRLCRNALGMTQREVAEASGLSAGYISLVEAGEREPSLRRLDDIAEALGVPSHLLLLLAGSARRRPDDLRAAGELLLSLMARASDRAGGRLDPGAA